MDPEGHGIHLAWSGPELLPLSVDGYEVRRRKAQGRDRKRNCAQLERDELAELVRVGAQPDSLGTIRARIGSWPKPFLTSAPGLPTPPATPPNLDPASAGGGSTRAFAGRLLTDPGERRELVEHSDGQPNEHPEPLGPVTTAQLLVGAETVIAAASYQEVVVLTQELTKPTDRVWVTCWCRVGFAVAVAAGKAVAVQPLPTATEIELDGQTIDTVVVYAVSPYRLRICVEAPVDPHESDREWQQADVLAKELTLPLVESDPGLGDRAGELAAARSRLLPAETLDDAEADRLAAALRAAAGRSDLGRPCDRVMLSRAGASDPFQETLFTARIALLSLDPRWRRVLGFGFADRTAVDGETYEYRVSGRFPADDLEDEIYDVHNVPSGTAIPSVVRIRDLTFAFPVSTKIVLDPPPAPDALEAVTRRGIELTSLDDPLGWLGAELFFDLCCVIELPQATDTVVLEVGSHNLRYGGGQNGDSYSPLTDAVPAGPHATLHFPAPVEQVRLAGSGTLYAVRLPRASGGERLHREAGPVTLAGKPLPREPLALYADNLQTPASVLTGPIGEQTQVPARPQPGFRVTWVPATDPPLTVWPDDLAPGPPLESIAYQIEHRRVYLGGGADPWDQLHAGDNLTFGSWPASTARPELGYGADLDAVFPIHPARDPGTPVAMSVTDVFGVRDPATGSMRPAEPLGSYHEYRIRAMDVVGRVSGGWTDSGWVRLEKHIPPPLPVGPQPPPLPAGDPPRLTGPVGVRARAIVASDPDLRPEDEQLLDGHASAVLLEWGWRDAERQLDPTTTEFRVYVQERVPTEVPGTIANVTASGGAWNVDFATDRWLAADECAGQWLDSGGWSFKIVTHSAGTTPTLTVAASAVSPTSAPVAGPAVFGRPVSPLDRRPATWTARVGIVPLGSADTYRYVIFGAVDVDSTNRRREAWVGVSAADAEPYIPDELSTAVPNGGRPGNESSIAAVAVQARYRSRPIFDVPPPIGDIPEEVSDEPTGRQVRVTIDGSVLLGPVLPATARVALDRCAADAILAVTRESGGNVLMRRRDGTTQTVVFPNPGDESAVLTTLQSDHPERLPSRYLLFLLGHFDRPDELLQPIGDHLQTLNALSDTVDPKPGRYFYRVRLADDAGTVSAGGAILPAVVRVPSTAPSPTPRPVSMHAAAGELALTIDVDPDPELRWVLLFVHAGDWNTALPDPTRAQLIRTPNRRDLYPSGNGIRLRLADGTLLAPTTKSLTDADVTVQPDGAHRLTLHTTVTVPPGAGAAAQYWCYALSRDGIPSRPLGPRSTGVSA